MFSVDNERVKTHVILTHEEWDIFRPMLIENGIKFEPSAYYEGVYIGFNCVKKERDLIDKLLERV